MGEAPTHVVHKQDSGQIRPERFSVPYGIRVPAHRKVGTSGMLRPDSAGIRPEQESCPGFRHPKNRNESRNVQPSVHWSIEMCRQHVTYPLCLFRNGACIELS